MMNKALKIITPFLAGMILFSSCNEHKSAGPFAKILSEPPYSMLTDSIKKEPQRDDLFFRRAVLLNQNDLAGPALADFQKAWSLKKDERYALGISTLLVDKKPDSAVLFLQQALKEIPNSLLLQLSLARAFNAQNKTDDALAICDDILKDNPQHVDVLKMKAGLLDKKGLSAEAIRILEKAYNLAPFDIELNYILAFRLAETRDSRVLSLCDSLIRADSLGMHAEPYYYKGIYYSNINDKAKALDNFDQAIKHDYYFLDGYIEKGGVLYDQKKYNEAYTVFNLALTISPKFADAYYWIAKCQEATGQKEEAKLNYQKAYSLDQTLTEARDAADKLK